MNVPVSDYSFPLKNIATLI